jgi:PAS domain S-box-containing protein
LSAFLPLSLRAALEAGIARALAGEVLQHDADVIDRDGRRLRFIVRYAPLAAPGVERPRVCFNAYDITDRAAAEDELRLRNHALSSVSQGVIIMDADRRVTYVNEGFTTITGYTPEDATGRNCTFIQGPGTDPAFTARLSRSLECGLAMEGEVLNYRKDGSAFWNDFIITPVRNARGELTQYVGVQRDITERRRHLDALAASQGRLQALFDHSNDAILLADEAGLHLDANPAACALLGYAREEIVGVHVSQVFGADGHAWSVAGWRDFLEKGRLSGECSLRRRDGTQVRAEFNAIARIQPGVHLSILRDVTERHILQARLLRQQRIESVGRLASGVAHDLNNILTPILMAPAILRPYLVDSGARMLLESVESSARRGSFIVRQLMTFARGDAGEKLALDLRDVLRDVGSIIRETFRKDLVLELAPVSAGAVFPVHGDPNQLHQAVLNLALNAADSMARGGRLILALERFEVCAADIADEPGARTGPHGLVTVVDHGAGIAPEHLDKIFDPFFTTKPFGQGSGLGLSVVLGIARGHGGFVRISSRPGVGTIARLYIPFRNEPTAPAAPVVAPPAAERPGEVGAGRVVLVVDDEAPVREIVRGILGRAGYEVHGANGADGAFSQIQASCGRLDLVLTDLAMPGVSGAKFIEMLRARRPDLPILILTGTDTRQDVPDALRATVSGVVAKPCDAATLLAAVERALVAREARAELPSR